jgi:uncharacterized C2H2 Zn-finger protein
MPRIGMTMTVCSMCDKSFMRNKGLNRHVMKNKCKAMKGRSAFTKDNKVIVTARRYPDNEYIGREYNFNPIPTGNRHYRSGIALPKFNAEPNRRSAI